MFFPVDYGFYQRKSRNQMPTMDEPTYFRCWEERILKYLDEGFEAALACSARDTDLPAVEKLLLRMSGQHGTELDFLDLRSLKDLTSEVARSEAIVSGRMHPLLMGHCYGCRLDPFVTSRKIASFQEEYVQGNFNTAEIQSRIEDTIRRVL